MAETGLWAATRARFTQSHGWRHVVDAAVPLFGYVVGYVSGGTSLAAAVSVAAAVAIGGVRRIRDDSLRTVVGATLTVIACASLAVGTGDGRSFFAPQVAFNVASAIVLAGSLLVGRPLTGYISQRFGFDLAGWHRDPERLRIHRVVTSIWVGFLVLRIGVIVPLYALHEVVALALADAVVLKPTLFVGLILTAVWLRRVQVRPALSA